jgi:hypothetical protein
MSTLYNVYSNGGSGGPIDYTSPIATGLSALTWTSGILANSSDYSFAVRAHDSVTVYEEANVSAVVRVLIDASGNDITAIPNAPTRLSARATASGGAHLAWAYNPAGQGASPTGFKVWATIGGTVNYAASPVLTVPYQIGTRSYSADLTGLTGGTAYTIGLRAYNATGIETNTTQVAPVTGKTTAPSDVDSLAATMTYSP